MPRFNCNTLMIPNRKSHVLNDRQVVTLSLSFRVQQIERDSSDPNCLYITLQDGLASVVIRKGLEEVAVVWANSYAYNRLGIDFEVIPPA